MHDKTRRIKENEVENVGIEKIEKKRYNETYISHPLKTEGEIENVRQNT